MSKFEGWLLKFGDTILPNRFFAYDEGWEITPRQRTELEGYRDDYTQKLYRITSEGLKTKIEAKLPAMSNEKFVEFLSFINKGLENELQRKYRITYWDPETQEYETGSFYQPDTKYSPVYVREKIILYKKIAFTLIEY